MIGEQAGKLTVESEAGRSAGGSRLWLCRCECGGEAIRSTESIREAQRMKRATCCHECLAKLRNGTVADYRERNRRAWRGLWASHGTLWSTQALANLFEAIRGDVDADGGGFVERAKMPVEVEEAECVRGGVELPPTLKEIGDSMGISRERVRQIEASAIRKLRAALQRLDPMLFDDADRIDAAIERTKTTT